MNRRTVLSLGVGAAAFVVASPRSFGADLKPLDLQVPAARALKYVDDAADADQSLYSEGARCANCRHYTAVSDQRGSCELFPNYSVAAAGWCSGWVAKPSTT